MQLFRFFETIDFSLHNNYFLNLANSHKIISVLRLKIGDVICVFNNTNMEFTAKIINLKNKLVEIEIITAILKNVESPLKIHLVQAIAKSDKMDWVIQKAVELGVHQITPIITERTIVKINSNQIAKKELHWQAIAIASCCQCGRNIVPKINSILKFTEAIKLFNNPENKLSNHFILSPYLSANNLSTTTDKILNLNKSLILTEQLVLIVGPEGGFSNKEIELAEQNNFLSLNLGPRILRTETAPLVAISIMQAYYGDLL